VAWTGTKGDAVARSRRRSPAAAHASRPAQDAQFLRGRDVAVTCRDRSRGTASADQQPAPRLLTGHSEAIRPRTVHLTVGAHLVAGRAADIRSVVDQALRWAPAAVTLRLDEVERFDAAGVGLLLRLSAQARRQGTHLVCIEPPRQLVVVLHRTRTIHALNVVT
jgi:anti-anti-sigma regulatory factor